MELSGNLNKIHESFCRRIVKFRPPRNVLHMEGCAGLAGTGAAAVETGLMQAITFVGLAVHEALTAGSYAAAGRDGEFSIWEPGEPARVSDATHEACGI
jgi:hypothetical protein